MIQRFSSRRQKPDHSFLTPCLLAAKAYDRIAGYFSSSILEVAGEALETESGIANSISYGVGGRAPNQSSNASHSQRSCLASDAIPSRCGVAATIICDMIVVGPLFYAMHVALMILPPFPLRLALLGEGARALLRVLGAQQLIVEMAGEGG